MAKYHFFFCQQMDLQCRMHPGLLCHIQHLCVEAEMPVAPYVSPVSILSQQDDCVIQLLVLS